MYNKIRACKSEKGRKSKRKNGLWVGIHIRRNSGNRGICHSSIVQCMFEQGMTSSTFTGQHQVGLEMEKTGPLRNVNRESSLVIGKFNAQLPRDLESSLVLQLVLEAVHCYMIVGVGWGRVFRGLAPGKWRDFLGSAMQHLETVNEMHTEPLGQSLQKYYWLSKNERRMRYLDCQLLRKVKVQAITNLTAWWRVC